MVIKSIFSIIALLTGVVLSNFHEHSFHHEKVDCAVCVTQSQVSSLDLSPFAPIFLPASHYVKDTFTVIFATLNHLVSLVARGPPTHL